jgi:phage RecT family recombinase
VAGGVRGLLDALSAEGFKDQVKSVIPVLPNNAFDVDRLVRGVIEEVRRDAQLQVCMPDSIMGAVLRCAEAGLYIGSVLGHAYLGTRPMSGSGGFAYEAELILGYKGMIALAMRSGEIASITARIVYAKECENEGFALYYEGEKDTLLHKPIIMGEKGEMVMAYCLVRYKDGRFHVEPMAKDEILAIKERALERMGDDWKSSAWVFSESEMWRKCPIRRAFKYLDLSLGGGEGIIALLDATENGRRQQLDRFWRDDGVGADGIGDATHGAAVEAPSAAKPPVAEAAPDARVASPVSVGSPVAVPVTAVVVVPAAAAVEPASVAASALGTGGADLVENAVAATSASSEIDDNPTGARVIKRRPRKPKEADVGTTTVEATNGVVALQTAAGDELEAVGKPTHVGMDELGAALAAAEPGGLAGDGVPTDTTAIDAQTSLERVATLEETPDADVANAEVHARISEVVAVWAADMPPDAAADEKGSKPSAELVGGHVAGQPAALDEDHAVSVLPGMNGHASPGIGGLQATNLN